MSQVVATGSTIVAAIRRPGAAPGRIYRITRVRFVPSEAQVDLTAGSLFACVVDLMLLRLRIGIGRSRLGVG
jgi:hypothetical protein